MISRSAFSIARTNHFIQTNILNNQQIARPNAPRIFIRDKRGFDPLIGTDGKRDDKLVVWPPHLTGAEKKLTPIPIEEALKTTQSGSKIMSPSRTVLVSKSELPTIEDSETCFGTGKPNFPVKVRVGKDMFREGDPNVQTKLPGQGVFINVCKSEYDVRGLKYLFAINQDGTHIGREMAECFSNRGILSHVKLAQLASLGGEVWFLHEDGAVHINLNSGRFPSKDDSDLDAVAKVWLAHGYSKVYVTPRDQRYGIVTPILYVIDHSSF